MSKSRHQSRLDVNLFAVLAYAQLRLTQLRSLYLTTWEVQGPAALVSETFTRVSKNAIAASTVPTTTPKYTPWIPEMRTTVAKNEIANPIFKNLCVDS
jgi:hypothetical protein